MIRNGPRHIAIIMDGNRRWAKKRGLKEFSGHKEGMETLEKIVEAAIKLGVKTLTVYALSTENLHERAKSEINNIFRLIRSGFREKLPKLTQNGVKPQVMGELADLPLFVRKIIKDTNEMDIADQKIKLNIAFNYGGRREIILAVKKQIESGGKVSEESFGRFLMTAGQSDPDLVIRTGGKVRLSNFLLWQTAYSEIYFTSKLWPDFSAKDLGRAVNWFSLQKRNFGK